MKILKEDEDNLDARGVAEKVPHHPEVTVANARTLSLWALVCDQVRTDFGGAYALDLAAVLLVLNGIGVLDLEWELTKMKIIFGIRFETILADRQKGKGKK